MPNVWFQTKSPQVIEWVLQFLFRQFFSKSFHFAISSPNHSIQIDAAFCNCINTHVRPIHLSDTVPNKKQQKTEFLYKKKLLPEKRKKFDAIWTKIGNILKPNTCYILKSVNSMKLIQIKWTQLVILKGEILFEYLSNQYILIFIVWRRRGWLSHLEHWHRWNWTYNQVLRIIIAFNIQFVF